MARLFPLMLTGAWRSQGFDQDLGVDRAEEDLAVGAADRTALKLSQWPLSQGLAGSL
jgi:hypothetical protein